MATTPTPPTTPDDPGTELVPFLPYHFAQNERAILSAEGGGGALSRVLASRKIGTYEATLRTSALRKATVQMRAERDARKVADELDEMDGNLVTAEALQEALAEERAKRAEAERANLDLQVIIEDLRRDVARVTAANAMAVSS